MPTSKMFFHTSCLFLDDLQYIEIIRYDFFFFTRIIFLGFRIFKVILTIILILRPTDPENNLVVVDLENFFLRDIFFKSSLEILNLFFGIFSTFFFSALFETDIYTRAMIFNSYYGRCFLKGFFFANFLFHRRIWILKSAEDDVFLKGEK